MVRQCKSPHMEARQGNLIREKESQEHTDESESHLSLLGTPPLPHEQP